jgi:hypothetical protein
VRFENGDRPQAVVMVSDGLELDLNHKPETASHRQLAGDSQRQLRIA